MLGWQTWQKSEEQETPGRLRLGLFGLDEHQFSNAFLYTKQCFGLVERMDRLRALRGEDLARCSAFA